MRPKILAEASFTHLLHLRRWYDIRQPCARGCNILTIYMYISLTVFRTCFCSAGSTTSASRT